MTKTFYPNDFSKEKYLATLKFLYLTEKNLDLKFTEDQIIRPIELVVEALDCDIGTAKYSSEKEKYMNIVSIRKVMQDDFKIDQNILSQNMIHIFFMKNGKQNIIEHLLTEHYQVNFPKENQDEYLDFISNMTLNITAEICNANEKKIPNSIKFETDSMSANQSEPANDNTQRNKEEPWVQRTKNQKGITKKVSR